MYEREREREREREGKTELGSKEILGDENRRLEIKTTVKDATRRRGGIVYCVCVRGLG